MWEDDKNDREKKEVKQSRREKMKKKLQNCSKCEEETWHMVGKKQATNRSSAYTRRTTCECTRCGTKEIVNKIKGRRIIPGKNESPCINKASLGGKNET